MARKTFQWPHLPALAAYVPITLLMASSFVSPLNLRGAIIMGGDPGLVMWTISWVNHALLTQPTDLFAANAFYPAAGSLSFSDHNVGLAILVSPWYWFSSDPFLPYNLLLLASYFASAFGMYLLCFHYTADRRASFIGGLIFGFCFFRAHHFTHLQVISNQWFPFVVLLFHRLRQEFTVRRAGLWILLTVLQCLAGWYNAFFLVMILAWVIAWDWLNRRWDRIAVRRFACCGVVTAALLLPFYAPYGRLPQAPNYAENKAFAADLGSYFAAPYNTYLGRYLGNTNRPIWEEHSTFIGYAPALLALAGILWGRRDILKGTYATLAAGSFVLSLGPESLDFPGVVLPARLLYPLCPPLAQLRASARFAIVVMFCVAILAAWAVATAKPKLKGAFLLLSIVILFEYYPMGFDWDASKAPRFEPRQVDLLLRDENVKQSGPVGFRFPRQRERKVVLELPDYTGTPGWFQESIYMVYSTFHWMNLANGYTRFYPPDYEARFADFSAFPAEHALVRMRETGVNYLVIHADKYEEEKRRKLESHPLLYRKLGMDWVYRIQ